MNTTSFQAKTGLLGSLSWQAIASGVFVALALQVLLSLLGLAFALGDEEVGGGYQSWAVVVQLVSIATGAALASMLSHEGSRAGGIATGIMTWAVVLVLGGAVQAVAMLPRSSAGSAWIAFFGAFFGLIAGILGGSVGSMMRGRPTRSSPSHHEETPTHASV